MPKLFLSQTPSRISAPSAACSFVAALGCAVLCLLPTAPAADTVYLSSPTSAEGHMTVVGTVLDYTSAGIKINTGTNTRTFPARLLQRIETQRTPSQLQGDSLYEMRDFSGALNAYRQAREEENRPWVRRELTARIVWCYRSLGNTKWAAEQFLLLVRADPSTPYFDCIPLAWYGSFQTRAIVPDAKNWLREDKMPAAVLLGASYLLQTEHGATAMVKLQSLAQSSDKNVVALARAQTWRSMVVSSQPSQVERWQQMVEEMPTSLRAGPYYVVGQGWARNQQWEKAALSLVRVPILYPEHRELASRSLLDAAMAMGKLQRQDEANLLYNELIQDYSESPLVTEARNRLVSPSTP